MSIFYVDKLLQLPIYSLFITQLLVVGYPKEIREKTWSKSNNNNNNKNNNNWQQKRRCTIAVRKLHAPGNGFLLISLTVKRELLANPLQKKRSFVSNTPTNAIRSDLCAAASAWLFQR